MKKLLTVLLCGAALVLSADILKEWKFEEGKVAGVSYPKKHIAFRVSPDVKTPDGEPCGEFTVKEAGDAKVPWSTQICFTSKRKITAGTKYRYSFQIRADRDANLSGNCIQGAAPWKTIGNSTRKWMLNTDWQTVSVEFTANSDYAGMVRTPMLMAGALPQGTKFWLGPVKFEKLTNFLPLALNPEWKISWTSDGAEAKTVKMENNTIDFTKFRDKFAEKTPVYLFNEFEAPADGMMQVGCAADYWFEFSVNGEKIYDTLETGNKVNTYQPTDHVFNFPVKKGKNRVVVKVLSGSAGWKFVCGKVPFREKTNRIIRIQRGKEWRPVKMDNVSWDKRSLRALRIDQFKRIPGSALDLSQYVKKYDIDRNGRLKADADGDLYFENAPGEKVRLRGFNFTPGSWEHRFYAFTKAEIEEFAEQIRLAGMNILRFHFLDGALAGNNGFPKQGKDRKDIAEIHISQSVDELKIDPAFADRYHYLLKCLRDRGVYVMLDIFTSRGLMTGAVNAKDYPRFQMFDNPVYQKHWKAAFDFLLKKPNPYTGKALIDDPQLIGITFFNEQEHLFGQKSRDIARFTPEWRKMRGPSAPEFDFELLRSDSPDGAAAREFLRGKIRKMNEFYLGVVRESGFKGFVTNWDMFMRGLEGDARADFNAIAMHTYHAHPNQAKLSPADFKQRLAFGGWFRGKMSNVAQHSSIVTNNYIGRAAATRVLGKPFFMTEFSHSQQNRYIQEYPVLWTAFASLQDWQILTPHANTVALYYRPLRASFDDANNLFAPMCSLFTAFGWQRGDIRSAKHSVSLNVPESVLKSPEYIGAIGSGYNALSMLTRIGSDYRNAKNPAATLNIVPKAYVGATSMGMYVVLNEEKEKNFRILREQVENLRRNNILPAGNRTNVNAGIFESETGEICTNVQKHTLTVNTPRFQSAVLKKSEPVALNDLAVQSVSTPVSITAISLENDKSIAESKHLLLCVATMILAENAVYSDETFYSELDIGDMQLLVRSGQFRFSLKNGGKGLPSVYALNLNGSRERKIPVELKDGVLQFSLDTGKLEYGTPYFEVVYP